jgi:hypothetical protein
VRPYLNKPKKKDGGRKEERKEGRKANSQFPL